MAQTLGRLMAERGERIVALSGRNRSRVELAARYVSRPGGPGGSIQVVEYSELPGLAARVLIAVSDQGIEPVADPGGGGLRSGVALRCVWGRGPDALRRCGPLGRLWHAASLQTIMSANRA